MRQQGAIFTQEGVAIRNAADYQKTIDTRWRFMDIAQEYTFDLEYSRAAATYGPWLVKILDHNLGYLPVFTHNIISDTAGVTNGARVFATTSSIYILGYDWPYFMEYPERQRGFVRVFKVNAQEEYNAPVQQLVPSGSPPNNRYGIKTVAESKVGLESHDLTKFSFNTDAKALAIQQIGMRTTSDNGAGYGEFTVRHDIGYPPTYLLAEWHTPARQAENLDEGVTVIDENIIMAMDFGPRMIIRATTRDITFGGSADTDFVVIILKEPAELAV